MTYKIKRPIAPYYIPLSDKIEKQLDVGWDAGHGEDKEVDEWAKNKTNPKDIKWVLTGGRGKGWHGDIPRHHDAALKNKNKSTLTTPIKASKPHSENCTCPDCTGESEYERNEQRKIKAWDDANIQW